MSDTPPPSGGVPPPPGGPQGWQGAGQPADQPGQWPAPHQGAGDGWSSPPRAQSNGLAVAALVCGILALLLSWIPVINFFAIILGIAAVVTGVIGVRRTRDPRYGQRGLAIGGLVTGGLGLVVAVAILAWLGAVISDPQIRDQIVEEFEREMERQEQLQEEGT